MKHNYSTYTNRGCRCAECRADLGRWMQQFRLKYGPRRDKSDLTFLNHGKWTTYSNHKCSCVECRAANAAYYRALRKRKADA